MFFFGNSRIRRTLRRTGIEQCQRFLRTELLQPVAYGALCWRRLLNQAIDRSPDLLVARRLLGLGHLHHVEANRGIVSPHRRAALPDLQIKMTRGIVLTTISNRPRVRDLRQLGERLIVFAKHPQTIRLGDVEHWRHVVHGLTSHPAQQRSHADFPPHLARKQAWPCESSACSNRAVDDQSRSAAAGTPNAPAQVPSDLCALSCSRTWRRPDKRMYGPARAVYGSHERRPDRET